MSKHTPGPWFSNGTLTSAPRAVWNTNGDPSIVPCESERQICLAGPDIFFDGKCPPKEELIANLQLIAAAPDLLAACKAYLSAKPQCDCTDKIGCSMASAREIAKAAIAKAEPTPAHPEPR